MTKKTLESILENALEKGWIDKERADAFRDHHPNINLDKLIHTIAAEAGLALTRTIIKEL